MAKAMSTHHLTSNWTFKQSDDTSENVWLPVKRVPTNVHLDLIDNGRYVITWGCIFIYLIYNTKALTDAPGNTESPTLS